MRGDDRGAGLPGGDSAGARYAGVLPVKFGRRTMVGHADRHGSGLSRHTPRPTDITVHAASRVLAVVFDDGRAFRLPFEFLRVHSPSAEVRGHGPGQERLQTGKREVTVKSVDAVGHYAIQIVFSDGHDTGLYSWDYLYELGINHDRMWAEYLQRLTQAGASRDAPGSESDAGAADGWTSRSRTP
jgi:DUF971 family protein